MYDDTGNNLTRGYSPSKHYILNIGAPKDVKQIFVDIKGEMGRNTVSVGDFNTPVTSMGGSSSQKLNRETAALKDTLDQMDLTNIFIAFHPKAAEYACFSSARGTFPRINYRL